MHAIVLPVKYQHFRATLLSSVQMSPSVTCLPPPGITQHYCLIVSMKRVFCVHTHTSLSGLSTSPLWLWLQKQVTRTLRLTDVRGVLAGMYHPLNHKSIPLVKRAHSCFVSSTLMKAPRSLILLDFQASNVSLHFRKKFGHLGLHHALLSMSEFACCC